MEIFIKYHDSQMPKLKPYTNADWIDLRVCSAAVTLNTEYEVKAGFTLSQHNNWDSRNRIYFRRGDVVVCRLGISMKLPVGKKAKIYPRSSLFKNTGLILTNSVGCIDQSYSGNDDEWMAVFLATRDGYFEKYERIAQFDIVDSPEAYFLEVTELDGESRGGFGSTGKL